MDVEVADFGGPWGYVEPEKPHYLGHRDRLRDRAAAGGFAALPDYELLELYLFRSLPRGDVKPLAKALRIAVHDHLVVGRQGVASFKALGLM